VNPSSHNISYSHTGNSAENSKINQSISLKKNGPCDDHEEKQYGSADLPKSATENEEAFYDIPNSDPDFPVLIQNPIDSRQSLQQTQPTQQIQQTQQPQPTTLVTDVYIPSSGPRVVPTGAYIPTSIEVKQCTAITLSGERCRHQTTNMNQLCSSHANSPSHTTPSIQLKQTKSKSGRCRLCEELTTDPTGMCIKHVHRGDRDIFLNPVTSATARFDTVIWMGDLNYRTKTTRRVADTLLRKNDPNSLLLTDELIEEMVCGRSFQGYNEGQITFRPTYKFDVGTDLFDTSEKRRIPSWTDRILYKQSDNLMLQRYFCLNEIRYSDHRPVVAHFILKISRGEVKPLDMDPTLDNANNCMTQ